MISLALTALLVACHGAPPAAPVAFPDHIGDFTRQDFTSQGAAYTDDSDPSLTVTVRIGRQIGGNSLVPALDLGSGDSVDGAITRAGAGIKRFYPTATLVLDEPLYLMRDGALKEGRHQSWRYRDQILGAPAEVAMDFVINCCNDKGELVSVWFRHRAAQPIEPELLGFLDAVPWE